MELEARTWYMYITSRNTAKRCELWDSLCTIREDMQRRYEAEQMYLASAD
jgi:hypothetical protein